MKSKFRRILKQWILFLIGALILYNGLAWMVISNIGLAPFDAITLTLSRIFNVNYGYASMGISLLIFLGNLALLNKRFPTREWAQLVIVFGGGLFMVFLTGSVYQNVILTEYWLRLMIFTLMVPVTAVGVLMIFEAKIMTTPLESFCDSIAKKTKTSLGMMRWAADGLFIVLGILLTLVFQLDWAISLGTIIGLVLFGPLLDLLRKPTIKLIQLVHLNQTN